MPYIGQNFEPPIYTQNCIVFQVELPVKKRILQIMESTALCLLYWSFLSESSLIIWLVAVLDSVLAENHARDAWQVDGFPGLWHEDWQQASFGKEV